MRDICPSSFLIILRRQTSKVKDVFSIDFSHSVWYYNITKGN